MPLPTPTLRHLAGVATAYTVCGLLALHIAIPPGYVSPLYPSAGIALAAMLSFGRKIWPAILTGAVLTNVGAVAQTGLEGWAQLTPLIVGLGAVLQAFAGAALARRWSRFPLDTAGPILRFLFLIGPVSCLIGASFGTSALLLSGSLPFSEAAFTWWNWWAGDAVGILIAAPIALAFIGQPRQDWAPRRLSIALPMLVALLILAALEVQVARWEHERLQARFERDAHYLSSMLRKRFEDYTGVLQATERVMVAAPDMDQHGFEEFAAPWLARFDGLKAIGWIPHVSADGRAAFEAEARASLITPDFMIRDRDRQNALHPAAPRPEYYPIRLIAPLESNRRALGLNILSVPNAVEAVNRSLANGKAASTRAFELTQETEGKLGVVVYQRTASPPPRDRPAAPAQGLAFVALRIEDAVQSVLRHYPIPGMVYCLTERTPDALLGHRIAGQENCPGLNEAAPGGIDPWTDSFDFAGRRWNISFSVTPGYNALYRGWEAWILLAIGLLSTGMLGAFLLSSTGRARRIEDMVQQRTQELADATRKLRTQQAMLTHAERIARLGSWELDPVSGHGHGSAELFSILGLPFREILSLTDLKNATHPDDRPALQEAFERMNHGEAATSLDIRVPLGDGALPERTVHFAIEAGDRSDGSKTLRGTVQDVTASRAAEAHIHYLAHYDMLTGLPNRSLWVSRAEQALAIARRNHLRMGVLFLDLDNFKKINDTLGHPVGDRLLAAAAQRLALCLREEDVLARLGGDEFVVLLPQIHTGEDAAIVARKLISSLTRPFDIDGQELSTSTSIGIALYPANGADVDILLKHADTAMYDAKSAGRNDFRFFTPDMNNRAYARLMLENALRHALERNELELDYQPQWAMPEQKLIGVEALVRWNHPERGRISPAEFIPLAEETGLIQSIGDWVLHAACSQQAAWQAAGLPPLTIAVNISALQFRRTDFAGHVRQVFADSGVSPAHFELEITESALMQPSVEIEAQFASLRSLGLGLALDDFGTGYSSLSYLKRLPLTRLKIDRSFVRDLPGDPEDAAIATATLSIARDLGLEVVAEGVETEAQRDFLLARQCAVMQGYLFSRPLPAAAITELLAGLTASAPIQ